MKALHVICLLCWAAQSGFGAEFGIQSLNRNGTVAWSNALPAGVVTVEARGSLTGAWSTLAPNYYTSNSIGSGSVSFSSTQTFVRLLSTDISTNTARHYTNLLESYGIWEMIAGTNGSSGDHISYWKPANEGGYATNANLSRPHIAFGDAEGNIYIVDQGSSAVEKVTPDGRIHTYAGTHVNGFNGDGPAPATNLQLNFPNGGWLRFSDNTFFVLDTENGKLRKITTNGIMSTMFTTTPTNYMGDGRALWVKEDESVAYFGSGPGVGLNVTTLNRWTPTGGVEVVSSSFLNIGNIAGDERTGDLYISDRNANRVYRMDTNFNLVPIAGNGTQTGGGEGFPALQTGLILPRSVWFIPNGGFFIGEHDPGNRIWYVDPAGIIHRWMNGSSANNYRVGEGQWFYANPTAAKVSRVRNVNSDPWGNLIIIESNFGYVHRIRFQRLTP